MRSTNQGRRAGFTLLEMMIVLAIFSVAVLAANAVSITAMGVFHSTNVNTKLDNAALRAIDRATSELVKADGDTFFPANSEEGTEGLLFQAVVGVDGDEPEWGPVQELVFVYASGEIDNGLDDNRDGLVDEGTIVLRRNVGELEEQSTTICRGVREHLVGEEANGIDDNDNGLVDEHGFCIQRSGEVLSIWISLEARDSSGELVVRTLQTSLRLRNGS